MLATAVIVQQQYFRLFLHQTKKRLKNETRSGENTFLQYHHLSVAPTSTFSTGSRENNKKFCFVRRNIFDKKTKQQIFCEEHITRCFSLCGLYVFIIFTRTFSHFFAAKNSTFCNGFLTKELINLF